MGLMRCMVIAALVSMLSGCMVVGVTPAEKHDVKPDNTFGWLAGSFSRRKTTDVAFVVVNADTGHQYTMSFGENSFLPKDIEDQVVAIKLPPGHYAVTQWEPFATLTKERFTKGVVTNPYVSAPFTIEGGSVTFIGKYLVEGSSSFGSMRWEVRPQRLSTDEAHNLFLAAYPAFGDNPFVCRVCTDTVRPAAPKPKTYAFPLLQPQKTAVN